MSKSQNSQKKLQPKLATFLMNFLDFHPITRLDRLKFDTLICCIRAHQ